MWMVRVLIAARIAPGPVERSTMEDVDRLRSEHPMATSLRHMSLNLARALDRGSESPSAVNRELRTNLAELARVRGDDDSLADDLSEPQ